jgi:class 3 adenylate cyclase
MGGGGHARDPGGARAGRASPDLLAYALGWTIGALLLGDAVHSRRGLRRAYRLLEAERTRSEGLLRNMLPEPIAERLKRQQRVIADAFGEVTVLFADIVDFTEHAARTPPEATVTLLNELFSRFDALTETRGLEKIKTVGDAYMVAGGLPDPMPDHAGAVAELALEMLNVATGRSLPDGGPVRLRIGLDVKGKGAMRTYFLSGRAREVAASRRHA